MSEGRGYLKPFSPIVGSLGPVLAKVQGEGRVVVMSEPSGGGADAGEVSDDVIDWIDKVDKFALSWFL